MRGKLPGGCPSPPLSQASMTGVRTSSRCPGWLTFEVGGANSGDSRGGGLSEAAEGCLLAGGLVRGARVLFVPVLVHPHGLEGELFPAEAHTSISTDRPSPGLTLSPEAEAHTSPRATRTLPPACPGDSHTDPHIVPDPLPGLKTVARGDPCRGVEDGFRCIRERVWAVIWFKNKKPTNSPLVAKRGGSGYFTLHLSVIRPY